MRTSFLAHRRARPTRPRRPRRPRVEALEGRALLTAGALDTTFGGTGYVVAPPRIQGVAIQSDLKTVVAGLHVASPGPYSTEVLRYNADGTVDTTFGNQGSVVLATTSAYSGYAYHSTPVAIQSDGKILVATNVGQWETTKTKKGTTTILTGAEIVVLRFNPDGSLDSTFGTGGEAYIRLAQGSARPGGIAVLSDGEIVVAGTDDLTSVGGPTFVVARLTASGALDPTFGPNGQGYNFLTTTTPSGSVTNNVSAIGLDSSGDILIGGWVAGSTGSGNDQVVRYTAAGLLDTTFASQGVLDLPFGSSYGIEGIGFQSNGEIIVGFGVYKGAGTEGVARLNPSGTVDTTFGTNGYYQDSTGSGPVAIAVQPDDKILIETSAGSTWTSTRVDRLLPGGSLDPAFGSGGQVTFTMPNNSTISTGLVVGPDGKITGTRFNQVFRLLNDITSNTATTAMASSTVTATPTAIMALTPDLIASALDSPDLRGALHPLPKRLGAD